ncbi:MAG: hypothetical protein U0U70_00505 [Chitinophagaceae bacterium]
MPSLQFTPRSVSFNAVTYIEPATGVLTETKRAQLQNNSNPDPALTNVLIVFLPAGMALPAPSYDAGTTSLTWYQYSTEALLYTTLVYEALRDTTGNSNIRIDYDPALSRVDFLFGAAA